MDYKAIYNSSNPSEMALIKHALKHADIPFRITNEGVLNSVGIAAMGNSGSEVLVESSFEEEARKLLHDLDLVN